MRSLESHEFGITQSRAAEPRRMPPLLLRADRAIHAIINDHDDDRRVQSEAPSRIPDHRGQAAT